MAAMPSYRPILESLGDMDACFPEALISSSLDRAIKIIHCLKPGTGFHSYTLFLRSPYFIVSVWPAFMYWHCTHAMPTDTRRRRQSSWNWSHGQW